MIIRESAEDYLESIYVLQRKHGSARSVDIANSRCVTKASVSVAMKQLRENGYISMGPDSAITLLPKGLEVAQRVFERHQVITQTLVSIGVPEEIAAEDACKIEHDISNETFQAMKRCLEAKSSSK